MAKINIHLCDGFTMLEPEIPEFLPAQLKYWHRTLEYDERRRARVTSGTYRELYTIDTAENNGQIIHRLITMPGFVSKISKLLTDQGYDYQYVDNRTKFPEPNIDKALENMREYQLECVHAALTSGGGIISAPCGFGKTHIIKAILRAYDREQLIYRNTPLSVVVAADMDICKKNYNSLKELLRKEREVGLVMTGSKEFSDDVQVITFDSLHHINPEEIGILLIDECHGAATDKRIDMVMAATKALKWGVSATPTGRFDGGDLVTEGLFGPIIYQSTYQEGVENGALVPIEVCWIPAPEPSIGIDKYNKYRKRDGKITHGIELNKNLSKLVVDLVTTIPNSMQTMVIVPHLQHMNEFRQYSRDIPIVHAEQSEDSLKEHRYHELYPISKKEREKIYDDMAKGVIPKIIATYVYKQGVDFPSLQIMICPGGGGSAIIAGQIPGRASRAGVEGKDKSYIVDFIHEWDVGEDNLPGPLLKDDKSRAKVYKELGFTQIKYDSIEKLPFIHEQKM